MKTLVTIALRMFLGLNGFTQQIHFAFAETIEPGQTLYFLKGQFDDPYDLMVTYPRYHDTIIYDSTGASTQITTYYFGYEEPSGNLIIPSTITHNDTVYTIVGIGFHAFEKCTNINSITLPNTLLLIQLGAFASCTGIAGEVVIPDFVTHLGAEVFRWCSNLTSVVFGNAVEAIGSSAFKDCHSLEHISAFPESLTRIYANAFENCVNLSGTIIIPSQVNTIDPEVFANTSIDSLFISEGVTTIKYGAFMDCPITYLYIPSSVISIHPENSYEGAFRNCRHLHTIIVDEANPVYDSRGNCNALIETATNTLLKGGKNTVIPNTIHTIGTCAFSGCTELDSITLPNSIERLEYGAFSGCNSLPTITLPSSLTYIGDRALSCTSLTSITSKTLPPPTAYNELWEFGYDNSFLGVNREIPIYVPMGTTEAYQNASGWNYFSNFIETEINLEGEWFYEILNGDGSITYQHLQCAGDTAIGNQRPKIIVRSNTQYDKDGHTEVTHEYVYEDNGIVYWWNKDLEEFSTLYNLKAETGDEWIIKVGYDSLIMHVDSIDSVEYEDRTFRVLHVSDPNDLFGGDIVVGYGHMTSFFPEKLKSRDGGYTVNGLRCYWVEDALLYHNGDEDCDAIYSEIHGVEEGGPSTPSTASGTEGALVVYPNPANNMLFVETQNFASLPDPTYRITNLMGQTLISGHVETRRATSLQIDVSSLPAGMYFINLDGQTVKFVKQ